MIDLKPYVIVVLLAFVLVVQHYNNACRPTFTVMHTPRGFTFTIDGGSSIPLGNGAEIQP